ncbi:MAG: ABC transporter substrate-binding protein [Desulfobacula sp.]|jgi:iron complex transport system substrate-binding protein|nr:ABC transporter substrate-binding protein [Desulfobacula sp.]
MIRRIISLTPSITETLFALGAGDRVVGVTDSCDFPQEANEITHVCSWFDPDMERIGELRPDLVIGLETAHGKMKATFKAAGIQLVLVNPVFMVDVFTDILKLGVFLELQQPAQAMVDDLYQRLNKLSEQVRQIPHENRLTVSRVLDVENDDLIVAGPKSFQFDVIKCAGGVNVTDGINEAYLKVSFEQFKRWNPEMIFFCGSDMRWIEKIRADSLWQNLKSVQTGRIYQFDCGLTCRTGPRIVDMAELLYKTLYA